MPISPGLCATCVHGNVLRSDRGSAFLRCTHPDLPKYPRLPVIECPVWQSRPVDPGPEPE